MRASTSSRPSGLLTKSTVPATKPSTLLRVSASALIRITGLLNDLGMASKCQRGSTSSSDGGLAASMIRAW
jgi:hypothetical protein